MNGLAELFIIAKNWNIHSKCPSMAQVKKIYGTSIRIFSHKDDKVLMYATTWMNFYKHCWQIKDAIHKSPHIV